MVDAGSGSGALALFLAGIARKVVSYEIREDFAELAAGNARLLKLKNLTVKNRDVRGGIDEREADAVTLDLPAPWEALDAAAGALKGGGFLASYSPTVPQVSDLLSAAAEKKFLHVKTVEVVQREWEFRERVVRPKSQAIGHSGFLSYLRKV